MCSSSHVFPMSSQPPCSTLFPYTTLFRSTPRHACGGGSAAHPHAVALGRRASRPPGMAGPIIDRRRSEEHTSELQSQSNLVCRLLLEKKKNQLIISLNTHMTFHKYRTTDL